MILSIITVNLNNAKGLEKTIKSVINQTFKDVEYIIIDGASSDNSVDIIQEYIKNHPIKWISESDTGVYEAMNKGIMMANGEYLLFLNSGDFLVDEEVINTVFSKKHSADILCGRCHVSRDGVIVWTSNPPEEITFGTLYNEGLAHQSTFIKRKIFHTYGMYNENYKYNSDVDFWYRTIIINNVSTEKLDVITTDYNLDGISSKENHTEKYKNELEIILNQSNFKKFLPDYVAFEQERKNNEVLYWIKSKKLLFTFALLIFKIARGIKK